MNQATINILRGLGVRALRAGLVQLSEIHELSRAMLALDAQEKILKDNEQQSVKDRPE